MRLQDIAAARGWPVVANWRLPRLGSRIDAVVLLPGAIVACNLRAGRRHLRRERDAVEDAALDLQDFHAGSQAHPIVPLLVTADADRNTAMRPLMLPGVTGVMEANAATLATTLADIAGAVAFAPPLDPVAWQAAAFRPIPSLIHAARALYARHGVAEIATAHADAHNLRLTRQAIADAIATRTPTIVFVTGIPGAGKTLCGLDTAFAGEATFLTGNPTLVHVLREALARDSAADLRAARQRMEGVIQALPAFRDCYLREGVPPERVIVIDEAQRCWSARHAVAKTALRRVVLWQSEPAHLLDIMRRREDGPVVVCLLGGGQEIHDGEGGLAEWGRALQDRPAWRVLAPAMTAAEERQRLPATLPRTEIADLHLAVAVRPLRWRATPAWVDAVLAGDAGAARALADAGLPFTVTRDLATMRARLRRACRGTRRCGLLASSGARRLRAEGLGGVLTHDDPAAVVRWFLDRFPDVRASDALEVTASEFFVQGLELDAVGLCWDGDLVRQNQAWRARAFRGTAWTRVQADKTLNRLNAYRVLLTRARYETVIWVPRGDPGDPTREPALLDAVADYLLACGARALETVPLPVAEWHNHDEMKLL